MYDMTLCLLMGSPVTWKRLGQPWNLTINKIDKTALSFSIGLQY